MLSRSRLRTIMLLVGAVLGHGILPLAHALVDTNLDGMSDVWQLQYPGTAGQPLADPDGDGRNNLAESRDGTNPFDSNSVFRVTGLTTSNTSSALIWRTVPGKRYQVYGSDDLAAWSRLGPQQMTAQPTFSYTNNSARSHQFYRVQLYESLDSDSDGLTDLEEAQLGTNPLSFDTDGDHVPDDVELTIGTDPKSGDDTDGDGLPDDFERWIIYTAQHDSNPAHKSIKTLADVLPGDSFTGDGISNLQHYQNGTSPVAPKRNVVMIFSDDLGYTLGCLGTPGIDTPRIDSLATNGMNFTRAFSGTAVCSPSRASLLTGMFPCGHSQIRNVPSYPYTGSLNTAFPMTNDPSDLSLGGVHEDLPTLIEILHDRHFYTAISQKTHMQPIRKFPFDLGSAAGSVPSGFTAYVSNVVASAGSRPVFIEANIGAPHRPFESHLKANGLLGTDGNPLNVPTNGIAIFPWLADTPVIRSDAACYFGAVEVVDMCVGAVLDALQANGLTTNNTLIIFSGDNGPGFHRSKNSVYPAGTHMPLLFQGPGVVRGRSLPAPVSLVDVAPTILEFLGIAAPPLMQGRSLWPILTGSQTNFPDRPTIFTLTDDYYTGRAVCDGRYYFIHNVTKPIGYTFANPPMNADLYQYTTWSNRCYAATTNLQFTDPYHYNFLANLVTGNLPDEELYDLDTDLWGVTNLIQQPALAAKAEELRRALRAWRYASEDVNTNAATETVRRALRTGTFPGSNTNPPPVINYTNVFTDSFAGKSGNLDGDPWWTTRIFGNSGADFTFTTNSSANVSSLLVKAAGGSQPPLATAAVATTNGQSYSASVDIVFSGDCVWNGLVFGYQDTNNFYTVELQDTAGGGQGTIGSRQVVRMRKRAGGAFTVLASATQATLADPTINNPYRLTAGYIAGSGTFTLSVSNLVAGTLVWSGSVNDTTFTSGSFGIIADTSGGGEYDNFSVSTSP